MEARRLGLSAYGGDLNPVATLISKGLVEIPPRFEGVPPVNPEARSESGLKTWQRAQGLAEDVGYYGRWMRERAFERIGYLYPKVGLPESEGGGEANVIAWIWARTVRSPDPSWNGHVPLVRSWVLRKAKKNKPVVWVEPIVDRDAQKISYRIREGGTPPIGTVRRGVGTCIATGVPIPGDWIKTESRAGCMDHQIIAIAGQAVRGRFYRSPTSGHYAAADCARPDWYPSGSVAMDTRNIWATIYGLDDWWKFFTKRQLVALATFSDLLDEVRDFVEAHARGAGLADDGVRLWDGGSGVAAYADAVVTYLSVCS